MGISIVRVFRAIELGVSVFVIRHSGSTCFCITKKTSQRESGITKKSQAGIRNQTVSGRVTTDVVQDGSDEADLFWKNLVKSTQGLSDCRALNHGNFDSSGVPGALQIVSAPPLG